MSYDIVLYYSRRFYELLRALLAAARNAEHSKQTGPH